MKFKIHFTVTKDFDDYEDYFIVDGETIEDIKLKAKCETDKRGLTEDKNNLWSEEVLNDSLHPIFQEILNKAAQPYTPFLKQLTMTKANEPAYPTNGYHEGTTKREKLAMEIYVKLLLTNLRTLKDLDTDEILKACAAASLRAADIFFEQLK